MILPAIFLLVFPSFTFMQNEAESFEEDKYGVKYASDCEVCKVVATEFEVVERLQLQPWKLHVDCEGQAVRE